MILLIYYNYQRLNFQLGELSDFSYILLIIAIPLVLLILISRYLRWRLLLSSLAPYYTSKEIFKTTLLGYTLLFLLPGNVGDFTKIYFLDRQKKILDQSNSIVGTKKELFGTVILERILDLYFLASTAFISGIILYSLNQILLNLAIFSGLSLFIIFLALLARKNELVKEILNPVVKFKGNPLIIVKLFFYTASGWISVYLIVFLLLNAFNVQIDGLSIIIYMPVISIMAVIPAFLGGIGARELGFVLFFGINAFIPGLLLSFYIVIIPAVIGFPILLKNGWILFERYLNV